MCPISPHSLYATLLVPVVPDATFLSQPQTSILNHPQDEKGLEGAVEMPCSTKQPWHYGTEAYDTEAYDTEAYDTEVYDTEAYDTEAYDTEAYDTEDYDTVDFLWTLWGAMFSIVRILPYNHPKQELFVEFLVLLRRGVMGTATVWGAEMRIWRDLPLLGPCLREEWGYSTLGEDIPTPEESSKWLGLNSFTARLHNESLVDATLLAMYELRTALEEEHPAREVADCKISVASEWIIKSGMKLYSEAPLHKDERWMNPTGPLYDGEAGISRERWQFWKLRFSEVKDKVDKDVAEMAQNAVCAMEKVEEA
ncbi:Protein of unknown function (DUF3632) domain containing protein [Elaphomyces granulatus]